MRQFKTFIIDTATKPPLMFPLVGLFHVLWLIWTIYSSFGETLGKEELISIFWMAGYTIFWLGACNLKRWGALGYMGLTLLNAILFVTLHLSYDKHVYTSPIFLIDGIFSFFLLFFYKRFS